MAVTALTEVDLAYAAGILDGEGCINIVKQKRKIRRTINKRKYKLYKIQKPYYRLQVNVCNTQSEVITWLWLNWGGSRQIRHIPLRRTMFYWYVVSRQAYHFLNDILPYLKLKRNQAKLAIAFQERRKIPYGSKGKKTDAEWALDEADKILMSNLKKEEQLTWR